MSAEPTIVIKASRLRAGIVAALMPMLLSACSKTNIEWTEEVQLQSGDIVSVRRTAQMREFGEIGAAKGWENEGMSVEITRPDKADNPKRWDAPFIPLIFDRESESNEWFVIATFASCTTWYELGKPKLPYTEFRYRKGQWIQQSLSPKFIGRDANMLTRIHASGEAHQTLASKDEIRRQPTAVPEFDRVVDHWTTGC